MTSPATENSSKTISVPAEFIAFIVLVAIAVPALLWRAWLTHFAWFWFAPMIGLPLLGTTQLAAGFALLTVVAPYAAENKTYETTAVVCVKSVFKSAAYPPILLLMAWLAHLFIC